MAKNDKVKIKEALKIATQNPSKLTKVQQQLLIKNGLDDFVRGGKTQSPMGDAAMLGLTGAAVKKPLKALEIIGSDPNDFREVSLEAATQKGAMSALNPISKIKRLGRGIGRTWDAANTALRPRQLATVTPGANPLKIPKTVEPVIDGSKPLQMTSNEAATTWGKVTKESVENLGITGAQKQSDTALSKVVRYVESGRHDKLSSRNKKAIIASQVENSPLKYLVKYSGGSLQKADSHHILDIDFWGRALDTPNNKAVSTVLWKDKVKTGNAGENIVWAWSRKKGSVDHDTLHRLYDSIPERQQVEALIANGRWQTMGAKVQAKMLRKVAYDQHRLTNNFMNMKLNFILREHPELAKLHPQHLRNKILKHPEKYGEIAVINPKDPNQVKQLLMTLQEAPNTGGVHPKVAEVFGLETPKAGAKSYSGSTTQKNFNLRLDHRLNKALKIKK